jgi:hypothetical protein
MLAHRHKQRRKLRLQTPQQSPVAGTQFAQPGYAVADADRNRIGAEGCRYLAKGQWPALETIHLRSNGTTQGATK